MKLYRFITLILLTLLSLNGFSEDNSPLKAASRELPVPQHASDSVREALSAAPAPDVEAMKNMPLPQSSDEWKSFIADFDKAGIEQGIELAETLGVKYVSGTVNGVDVYHITPVETAPKYKNNLFVHIHGGAFLYGGRESSLRESVRIAYELSIPVLSIDYRKAPDHPAPAAVNDIVAVWSHLITERPADSMIMGGTSAGGNLTTAATMRIRDLGLPLPSALFIGTPSAVLENTTDSRIINEGIDVNLVTWDGLIEATIGQYIGGLDPRDPYISPLYGSFHGFPPAILVSGTRDLLLSDTVLLHRAIRDAGSPADLHIYEGHSHGFYLLPGEDMENFYRELDTFTDDHLRRYRRLRRRDLFPPVDPDTLMISEKVSAGL